MYSLTGGDDDCTIYTSLPRTLSRMRTLILGFLVAEFENFALAEVFAHVTANFFGDSRSQFPANILMLLFMVFPTPYSGARVPKCSPRFSVHPIQKPSP